jgi:hypothetical protein
LQQNAQIDGADFLPFIQRPTLRRFEKSILQMTTEEAEQDNGSEASSF